MTLIFIFFRSNVLVGNAPLTAVQLLWVNMIMDTLGALALATEPPNDDLMKRSPVGRKGNFISNVMWRNILGQSMYQFVMIWYLQTRGKAFFHLDGPDSDLVLNTLIFNAFVFCQVVPFLHLNLTRPCFFLVFRLHTFVIPVQNSLLHVRHVYHRPGSSPCISYFMVVSDSILSRFLRYQEYNK